MCFVGLSLGSLARITILHMGICMLLCVYVLSSVGFVCVCVRACVCAPARMCMHASMCP